MRIFLVEDSSLVRGRLAEMLATIPGVSIVGEAERALPAIRDILDLRPDLVLLDIHLAEGSGFDVLNGVHVAAPEIHFCVLSTFANGPYRQAEIERVRDVVARRVTARQ